MSIKDLIFYVIAGLSVFGMISSCDSAETDSLADNRVPSYVNYPISLQLTDKSIYNIAYPSCLNVNNVNKTMGGVNYYTNSWGEKVQSPTYYSSKPAGATARCVDGTYSFSKSRRGTCSHHGGVAVWY